MLSEFGIPITRIGWLDAPLAALHYDDAT